ncbi:LOW QUALITY PROTEIN: putative amidase C869.01 [Phalaenopsis equestris]|uniref:LOW QUALITY PROTEIN: putative amidase C869.01 n=1 Tax=Phalaenopsis equestris TaxID=78828 RepID=UPI0009E2F825|nr:LOW QUALITY PROTEIN: putative amidase C869.01 [Phalaenopsis equestris]
MATSLHSALLPHLFLLLPFFSSTTISFNPYETTISQIQSAFSTNQLTSRQLVRFYFSQIRTLNPKLHAVIETNPDALFIAGTSDYRRNLGLPPLSPLDGIPILLKDNIATLDRLNTTAGSFALLGSTPPRDATVVQRLRLAGAVILGKASLSEWDNFRSINAPDGWSPRGGQGVNPYNLTAGPCGSSSGPAIAVAANMVVVGLGTETDGSILCPAARNSVVGIKPTVGLTSRAGVVPISKRQDTVGVMGRTVEDAVAVLEVIVGFDVFDAAATAAAAQFIPAGGYRRFLNAGGLKGKRIGILRRGFFDYAPESVENATFESHFLTIKRKGAILVDNIEIPNVETILDPTQSGEVVGLLAEFKLALNAYLRDLITSPVRSLADVIAFNNNHPIEERLPEYGQAIFLAAESTTGLGPAERAAIKNLAELSKNGLEKVMKEKKLDAIAFPDAPAAPILAIGGYPAISVPAGYDDDNVPFGIGFGALRGSEPRLIEIAYGFEQATKVRRPPQLQASFERT